MHSYYFEKVLRCKLSAHCVTNNKTEDCLIGRQTVRQRGRQTEKHADRVWESHGNNDDCDLTEDDDHQHNQVLTSRDHMIN